MAMASSNAHARKSSGMGSAKPNSYALKTNSVRIMDNTYNPKDVLRAIASDIGKENIIGCVKTSGQWIITLKNLEDADLLQETGLNIKDDTCTVTGVTKSIVTVSLFGVPSWIDDRELSERLQEFGCTMKTGWTRKYYEDYPAIENGIRFVRLELPKNTKSLPYAITVGGVHMRLKHNGQIKVCNRCLSTDHIMKDCPQYTCRGCGEQGHSESRCPEVKCFRCNQFGHKSFLCNEEDMELEPAEKLVNVPEKGTRNQGAIDLAPGPTGPEKVDNERNKLSNDARPKPKPKPKPKVGTVSSPNQQLPKETPPRPPARPHPLAQNENANKQGGTKRTVSSDDDDEWSEVTSKHNRKSNVTPNLSSARRFTPNDKQ